MASYPPQGMPPIPPPGYDPRDRRRFVREQQRFQRDAMKAQRDQMRYQMRGMRRTSVLGPILLVILGILFLLIQTGHLPHQRLFELYSRFWPWLLVVGGIIMLAEWGYDQFALRDPLTPRYRRSLGGGAFTLLLLLGAVGFITSEARLHVNGGNPFYGWHFGPDDLDEFIGDKHESDQTLDLTFPAGSALLTVSNPHGDVTVSGTSNDEKMHVAIHKQVYTRTDSDADAKAERLTPQISGKSSAALTLTMPTVEGGRADLVITVPASAATTITANHGDIHLSTLQGTVFATANHGDIELSGLTGPATAHINSGGASISAHSLGSSLAIEGKADDVTLSDIAGPVTITGDFYGDTHLEHVAGSVHFHSSRTDLQLVRLDGALALSRSDLTADQVVGPFILTTSHFDITLDRIAGDISVTNRNGSIDLTAATMAGAPALGNISLQDRNGAIKAMLPDHTGFVVQANTTNGNIDNDFGLPSSDSQHANTLAGTVGSGGGMVRISTTNADITIHKAQVIPLHLTAPQSSKVVLVPPATPQTPHPAKLPTK